MQITSIKKIPVANLTCMCCESEKATSVIGMLEPHSELRINLPLCPECSQLTPDELWESMKDHRKSA